MKAPLARAILAAPTAAETDRAEPYGILEQANLALDPALATSLAMRAIGLNFADLHRRWRNYSLPSVS